MRTISFASSGSDPSEPGTVGTRAGCAARSRPGWRSGSFQTFRGDLKGDDLSPPFLSSADDEQGLAVFDGLAVLHQDCLDHARGVGLDLVHQLHRFDDADSLA